MNERADQLNQPEETVAESDVLRQVGERLRQARSEQKLGLEEVAERLRLSPAVVSAIEAGDSEKLPAMTFVRGYIRSYARLLKIEEQSLLSQLAEVSSQVQPPLAVSRRMPSRPRLALPSGKWVVWGMLAFALVILLVYGLPAVERLFSRQPQSVAPTLPLPGLEQPLDAGTSDENGISMVEEGKTEQPAANDTAPAAEASTAVTLSGTTQTLATGSEPVTLSLYCISDSWVEVSAEGKKQYAGIMRSGTSETIRARPPFDILIGNAPAIEIKYNGEPFDTTPFRRGKVARFTLNN